MLKLDEIMDSNEHSNNIEQQLSKININRANLKLENSIKLQRSNITKKSYNYLNLNGSLNRNLSIINRKNEDLGIGDINSYPILSTAKRSGSKNALNKFLNGPEGLETPLKNNNQNNLKSVLTIRKVSEKNLLNCATSETTIRATTESPLNRSYSFMKETTSSLQKKQLNPFNIKPSSPIPNIIPKKNISSNQRRLEYSRQISQPFNIKLNSPCDTKYLISKPSDITNLNYNKQYNSIPVIENASISKKTPKPTDSADLSPTKAISRISSQLTTKDDMYNRLHNNNSNDNNSNNINVNNNNNDDDDDGNNNSTYIMRPIYDQGLDTAGEQIISRATLNNYRKYKILAKSSNNLTQKIKTLFDLYKLLYEYDFNLFDNKIRYKDFNVNKQYEPQNINKKLISNEQLNMYETGEILHKNEIYFIPESSNTNKSINIRNPTNNFGFDDKNNNYIIIPGDHIDYRYEIENILGAGSFGNAVKCKDHKYINSNNQNMYVAVKIIRNNLDLTSQAVVEIKILKYMNESLSSKSSILKYFDHFHFRGHMCIVTELLSIDLYTLLKLIGFKGLSLNLLKCFCIKILNGLEFVHEHNIIHCDLKPENIMIKLPSNFSPLIEIDNEQLDIKIIDFGSSCFKSEITHPYIQSRFYRSPEVILGTKYNEKIDIWSFGCVVTELFMGLPLLPGKTELEQIGYILEFFGAPKSSLILTLRKKLLLSMKRSNHGLMNDDNLVLIKNLNEKNIKKLLLYTLFDVNGKINLQLLNNKLALYSNNANKRQIKLNSKNLEIYLKLNIFESSQSSIKSFINFLHNTFKWDPTERLNAKELLNNDFLKN